MSERDEEIRNRLLAPLDSLALTELARFPSSSIRATRSLLLTRSRSSSILSSCIVPHLHPLTRSSSRLSASRDPSIPPPDYLSKMPPQMPAEILKLRELISSDPTGGATATGAWDEAWRANVTPWDSKLKDVQPSLRELVDENWDNVKGVSWDSLRENGGKALVAGCGRVSLFSSNVSIVETEHGIIRE